MSDNSPPPSRPSAAPKLPPDPLRVRSPILRHLRRTIFSGLLTAIPLFITLWVLTFLYGLVTAYTHAPADWLVDRLIAPAIGTRAQAWKSVAAPVLAVLISAALVYLLGLFGTFFVGRQIWAQVEHFLENLPLIKGIYGTTKQVVSVFQGGGGQGFQRVVLVEFPRQGTFTVAFVTNTLTTSDHRLVCCFIPMTPNPTSGFFQMFPEQQVRNTDWTVDMGIKIVLSGGLLAPSHLEGVAPKTD
ncbi:MAG TPA: DUF502 domain-containing protein [Phycisphaerae bacterium]|nr:DUF502 domain-containing protein [Phycisphaerae bacterium]